MARVIDTATAAALILPTIYECWLIRLDIASEPVYIHTGLGDLFFGSGLGYDAPLVGFTFTGVGNIGQIDPINDGIDGSQSLNLVLPGVDTSLDYFKQFVTDGNLWQRRQAWIWFATMDATGALVGKPIRVKTGRMDKLPIVIDPENGKSSLTVTIESQQSYSGQALFTRYVEQSQIDSTDTSQNFIAALANKVPSVGNQSTDAAGGYGRGTLPNKYDQA